MRNPLTADEPVAGYESNVFINCPFDKEYHALLRPLLFTFKRALSDLSGVDIKSHKNKPNEVVRAVRDWFVETVGLRGVKTATVIWYLFNDFTSAFYEAMVAEGSPEKDIDEMPLPEYLDYIRDWVDEHKDKD